MAFSGTPVPIFVARANGPWPERPCKKTVDRSLRFLSVVFVHPLLVSLRILPIPRFVRSWFRTRLLLFQLAAGAPRRALNGFPCLSIVLALVASASCVWKSLRCGQNQFLGLSFS